LSKSRSGAPRRVAVGLLAGLLTVVGFALAPPAGAVDSVTTDRVAGTTRYGTAAAVAGQDEFSGATTAILATGETFPDALAASGLAGADAPAPIVLTQSDTYTQDAQQALNNLTSVTNVVIVGGTAAISNGVEDAVKADGFTVTRVAGNNRYETAAAIADEMGTVGSIGGLKTAIIATGTNFADALSGGPVAYKGNFPLLLVTPDSVPSATEAELNSLGIQQVLILGGTAAVSNATQSDLEGIVGNPAVRIAGTNRFGTSADVAQWAVDNMSWAPTEVLLANGLNFPDALSGGPLGGERQAPILLTASIPDEIQAFLDAHSDTIAKLTALGGTGVISDDDIAAAQDAAQTTDNDNAATANGTATTKPELVSAAFVETVTATFATTARPAGTYIKYTFDEQITGKAPTAAKIKVYSAADVATAATTATVMSTDNKSVEAYFPTFATASAASVLTTATVDDDAVEGQAGASDPNIEGDAGITPPGGTSAAAGVTDAPDLVTVGNFRAGTSADVTAVDFTFDEAAYVANVTQGFHLVALDGSDVVCTGPTSGSTTVPSGGTIAGGEGTTTFTVLCNEAVGAVHWDATMIARGYTKAAAVGDAAGGGGNTNPLEAADVSNGGNSDGPDLSLAVFAPASDSTTADVVAYIFDEPVAPGTIPSGGVLYYATAANFGIYKTDGTTFSSWTACTRSTENNSTVLCLAPNGTINGSTFVGANVKASTVTDTDTPATANDADEVAVSPSGGSTAGADRTSGPDLTGVAENTVTSPFGTVSHTVTYTFDEDTADGSGAAVAADTNVPSLFHLYESDGIRLDCASFASSALTTSAATLAARDEDHDNTITCTSFVAAVGGAAATDTQVHSAVVGTVDAGAADGETVGSDGSPEGAALVEGTIGTAQA